MKELEAHRMFIAPITTSRSEHPICLFFLSPIVKSSIFLLLLLFPALLQAQENTLPLFAMKGIQVKGIFVDENKGQKVSWETKSLDGNLKTQFITLEKPSVKMYGLSQTHPIEIQSQILKIDTVQKDLMFEGNIQVRIENKILKTNFLKVNTFNQTLTSFDTFTLETQGNKIKGRAFYGSAQEKILQLLNLKNGNFSLSIPLPL